MAAVMNRPAKQAMGCRCSPAYLAEDVDMDFHGDIRLISTVEGRCIEYAARFTHGNLEWIRPWSELPELHQSLLTG